MQLDAMRAKRGSCYCHLLEEELGYPPVAIYKVGAFSTYCAAGLQLLWLLLEIIEKNNNLSLFIFLMFIIYLLSLDFIHERFGFKWY